MTVQSNTSLITQLSSNDNKNLFERVSVLSNKPMFQIKCLETFFSECHISCCTTIRGSDTNYRSKIKQCQNVNVVFIKIMLKSFLWFWVTGRNLTSDRIYLITTKTSIAATYQLRLGQPVAQQYSANWRSCGRLTHCHCFGICYCTFHKTTNVS